MDPLSMVASIVALVEVSGTTLSACYQFISKARQAQTEVTKAINEISVLKGILEALKPLVASETPQYCILKISMGPNGPFQTCTTIFGDIQNQLDEVGDCSTIRTKMKWPRVEKKIAEHHRELERLKPTFLLALTGDISSGVKRIEDVLEKQQFAEKRSKVMAWLRAKCPDPATNFNAARGNHEPHTGKWLLHSEDFIAWKQKSGQLLWLKGIPGAGKTVLSSTVIDHLQGSTDTDIRVAYFFFDFSNNVKRTARGCIQSLVLQFCEQADLLPESIVSLYDASQGGSSTIEDLTNAMTSILKASSNYFVVIDAMDECFEKDERRLLFKCLKEIKSKASDARFFISSRAEPDIESTLRQLQAKEIFMDEKNVDEDIRLYVRSQLEHDEDLKKWSKRVKDDIEDKLLKKAKGMFRWVSCQLDTLRGCVKERLVRQALDNLPDSLDETYERIFKRIPPGHEMEVKTIITLLAFSTRPMAIQEIAEATAVDVEEGRFSEEDRLRHPYDVLELCTSLVTLAEVDSSAGVAYRSERGYSSLVETKTDVKILQFAHYTVKEFVLSSRAQCKLPPNMSISALSSQIYITKMCLIYLLDFNGGRKAQKFNHNEYPFLAYSALHWTRHWAVISPKDKAEVEEILFRLFDTKNSDSLRNYLNLYNPVVSDNWIDSFGSPKVSNLARGRRAVRLGSALYYACYLGLENIATWILDETEKIESDDLDNALGAAAIAGQSAIVDLLLRKGANPNGFNRSFNFDLYSYQIQSSLQAAAYSGDAASVSRLLEAGAVVNQVPSETGTALHVAALRGHDSVVTTLLDNGADINSWVNRKGAVVTSAAEKGHESTVILLLSRGADPNQLGGGNYTSPITAACDRCSLKAITAFLDAGARTEGTTALYAAAERGDLDILKLLLARGADVNGPGGIYGSPLQASIQSRKLEVFEFMVASGADIQVSRGTNNSALGQAVFSYNLPVGERLLELGARIEDTALIEAIDMGLTELAKTLLSKGANPNAVVGDRYKEYGNALVFAISKDRDEIVSMLLEKGADVNQVEGEDGTALLAAASRGKESIVQQILDRGALINPPSCGRYGTPLQAATISKNLAIIRKLIDKGADVNSAGGYYGTALQAAVYTQQHDVMHLLLNLKADVNIAGGKFGTTLRAALVKNDLKTTELLLHHGADVHAEVPAGHICVVNPYTIETFRFAIEVAVATNNTALVQLLLDRGADINCSGASRAVSKATQCPGNTMLEFVIAHGADVAKFGGMALEDAVNSQSPEKIQLLLGNGADINTICDSHRGTALEHSISYGYDNITRQLLDAGADIDFVAGWHGTALQEAIEKGNDTIARELLKRGANINIAGGTHGSALAAAVAKGDEDMFKTLLERGADVKLQGGHGGNPLQTALRHDLYDFANELIKRGADIHATGQYGSALIAASGFGASNEQRVLVAKLISLGADLEANDELRGTALQTAAYAGNEAVAQILIDAGARVNSRGGTYGNPLQSAVVQKHLSMTKLLLSQGADVNAMGGLWGTALQIAIWERDQGLVQTLLDAGADVNREGGLYGSALQAGCRLAGAKTIQRLLDLGAKVNTSIGWHGSPLQAAARSGNLAAVKLLLQHGADVNLPGGKHGFALQAAACAHRGDHASIIKVLLDAGADVNAQGGRFGTALQAAAYHSLKHVEILIAHGANVNAKGGRFGSPLLAAKAKGLMRVVKLLEENGAKDDGASDLISTDEYVKKPAIHLHLA